MNNPHENPRAKQMFQHICLTGLIVALVYIPLVYAQLSNDQAPEPLTANEPSQNTQRIKREPAIETAANDSAPVQQNQPAAHAALSFFALVQRVNLNEDEITVAWERFNNHTTIHQSVSWLNTPVTLYAYYNNFNADFDQADLAIGYANSTAVPGLEKVTIKTGKRKPFAMPNGLLSQAVWEEAWEKTGVILEQYQLNADGKTLNAEALLIH